MTRRLIPAAVASALVLAATVGVFDRAGAETSSASAARLVARMREAPSSLVFSGMVRVTWVDHGAMQHATVRVSDDLGTIAVESDASEVFARGGRTYFKDDVGWSSALIETNFARTPSADHHWTLVAARGRTIAGRPTRLVEARRRNGTPVARLFLDRDTGLVLRRDVLDASGDVERSLRFVQLDFGAVPSVTGPSGVGVRETMPLHSVPEGYVGPSDAAGFVLLARSRQPSGVEFLYGDGVFAVSVLEQRGDLDWDSLPPNGRGVEVADQRARRYVAPSADVVVWEHDGTVFTLASDAPDDVVEALVERLTGERSTLEKMADYVLGPFGWG